MSDAVLEELASLVAGDAFRAQQIAFFEQYCGEFDDAEENKLVYTEIHKKYEEQVEAEITQHLGEEKMAQLLAGLEAYLNSGEMVKSEAAMEAIDVLLSLSDFESFKRTMIAKKAALAQPAPAELQGLKAVLQPTDVLDRTAELTQAANEAEGWVNLVNEAGCVMYTKPGSDNATYLRYTFSIDLPVDQALDMTINYTPESMNWREGTKSIEIVRENGPDDKIVKMEPQIPWAMKYIMNIPSVMHVRTLQRRDFPEAGSHAYCVLPFDPDTDCCVESMGHMKVKTGVLSADPNDPSKTLLTGMDLADLGYIPNFALGYIIKKMSIPTIETMTKKYKKYKGL